MTLTRDLGSVLVPRSDPASAGPESVDATGLEFRDRFPIVVYRPHVARGLAPAVVFLPGRLAPEDQYESYARALASYGFVVVVRGRYAWSYPHEQLMRDAIELADWLRESGGVDPQRVGVAGHSMGAQCAIWAAREDPRFRGVVAIDPGDSGPVSAIHSVVEYLHAPLLLIGAEVAWRGWRVCAPREVNYQRYFEHSPPGTLELTLRGADHVQVMDEPDALGQQICRVGTADSVRVRTLARRATVQFFGELLQGRERAPLDWGDDATLRVRPAGDEASAAPGATK